MARQPPCVKHDVHCRCCITTSKHVFCIAGTSAVLAGCANRRKGTYAVHGQPAAGGSGAQQQREQGRHRVPGSQRRLLDAGVGAAEQEGRGAATAISRAVGCSRAPKHSEHGKAQKPRLMLYSCMHQKRKTMQCGKIEPEEGSKELQRGAACILQRQCLCRGAR